MRKSRSYDGLKDSIRKYQQTRERVYIVLTPEEKEVWKKKADAAGMPLATYIKAVVNNA